MTNLREEDPTAGIVDIDTFGEWVRSFRASVIKDPTINRSVEYEPDLEEAGALIFAEEIPWKEIPESLQAVIALQYESAMLSPQQNSIEMTIEEDEIRFKLDSPFIARGGTDIYGETHVSRDLMLYFPDDSKPLLEKGWNLTKQSVREFEREANLSLKGLSKELSKEEQNEFTFPWPEAINATILQLHDVARLLTQVRDRIQVREFRPGK